MDKDTQSNTGKLDTGKKPKLEPGTHLGRYLVIEPLGAGGMGEVYKAYDPKLNRGVALKIMTVKDESLATVEEAKQRLLREAQALAQLSHPNVVAIHDFGEHEEDVYIAMELVEGKTLRDWISEHQESNGTTSLGRRTVEEVLPVMIAAGEGLAAAHKVGLVHRDFKPQNVIIGNDGRVRVLDFGLVRAMEHEPDFEGFDEESAEVQSEDEDTNSTEKNMIITPLTRTNMLVGTTLYMAPEQHMSLKTDHKTDQFSYCVVLYEALYGQRPFKSDTLKGLRKKILRKEVEKTTQDTNVPVWLNNLVMKGLEPNPKNRFASMETLLDKLRNDPEKIAKQKRAIRNRTLIIIALGLLVIILPLGVWYGLQYRKGRLCKDTSAELVSVWDEKVKMAVKAAFMETRKPYALWTWERVDNNFNDYLKNWSQMRSDICDARWIRGTESDELFDLRMSCLKERKQELKALSKVFARADSKVVDKAVRASSSLTGIDTCADGKTLHAPYPPPKGNDTRTKVEAIREKLAEVEALEKTGKYKHAFELSKKIEGVANALEYEPIQAECLYWTGLLLERVGEYKSSEKTLTSASQKAGKCGHSLIAVKAMASLVKVVGYHQARYAEGLLIGRHAEIILGIVGGKYHRNRLLVNLGNVLLQQGKYDEALEYYRRALVIYERALGPEHPEVASMLNNIGLLFYKQDKYDKALDYHRRAFAIYEKALGPEHPTVAFALNSLGIAFFYQGKYEKSLEYYRRALSIQEKALGPKHPHVAGTLNNLGIAFEKLGEFDKSTEHYRKALTIFEQKLGSEHPNVATMLNNLGGVFLSRGNYGKALDYYRRAFAIKEKALGQGHPSLAPTLGNLGNVFYKQGKYPKALEYYRKTLVIQEKTLGPEHPDVAHPLTGIGLVFLDQGMSKQALKTLERVFSICEKSTCDSELHGKSLFALARAMVKTYGDRPSSPGGTAYPAHTSGPSTGKNGTVNITETRKDGYSTQRGSAAHQKGTAVRRTDKISTFGAASRERAIILAKLAREIFEKTPKAHQRELKEVDLWLEKYAP